MKKMLTKYYGMLVCVGKQVILRLTQSSRADTMTELGNICLFLWFLSCDILKIWSQMHIYIRLFEIYLVSCLFWPNEPKWSDWAETKIASPSYWLTRRWLRVTRWWGTLCESLVFSLRYTLELWTFGTFFLPNLNFSQMKLGTFLIFWRPPPLFWTNFQVFPLFQLESFP